MLGPFDGLHEARKAVVATLCCRRDESGGEREQADGQRRAGLAGASEIAEKLRVEVSMANHSSRSSEGELLTWIALI